MQCTGLHWNTVHYSAVQCIVLYCHTVEYCAVQCTVLYCHTVQYSAVHCAILPHSAVQCSAVTVLHWHTVQHRWEVVNLVGIECQYIIDLLMIDYRAATIDGTIVHSTELYSILYYIVIYSTLLYSTDSLLVIYTVL